MRKSNCDGGIKELNLPESDVQYPFASIEDGSVISIASVDNENRRLHKYTCPGCKEEFRPRLGSKRAHCFYHYTGNRCDINKYIHDTAELVLKQKFDNEEKFEIVMSVRRECANYQECIFKTDTCSWSETNTYDLKKHFKECLVEHRYGEFVPDLLLLPKDETKDPIFIEIWNKHKNSEKKANSKYKIIEIKVQSMQELEELPKYPIKESETVTFSHFKTVKPIKPEKMEHHVDLIRYMLFERGTSFCGKYQGEKCYSYGHVSNQKVIFAAIGRVMDFANGPDHDLAKGAMREFVTHRARMKGYNPRSCYECVKSLKSNVDSENNESAPTLCCGKDRFTTGEIVECKHEDALTCEHFVHRDYRTTQVLARHRFDPIFIWEREEKSSEEDKEFIQETERMKRSPYFWYY